MHLTIRGRIIDLAPIVTIFAIVALFATWMWVVYVLRQPIRIPDERTAQVQSSAPAASSTSASRTRHSAAAR